MTGRDGIGRHLNGKLLDVLCARESADEWLLHHRGLWTRIGEPIWRIAGWVGDGETLGRGKEAATTDPDTRLARPAGEGPQYAV